MAQSPHPPALLPLTPFGPRLPQSSLVAQTGESDPALHVELRPSVYRRDAPGSGRDSKPPATKPRAPADLGSATGAFLSEVGAACAKPLAVQCRSLNSREVRIWEGLAIEFGLRAKPPPINLQRRYKSVHPHTSSVLSLHVAQPSGPATTLRHCAACT